MVGLFEGGATYQAIANRFNVTKSCVWKIVQKYRATGSVNDLPRSGRPKVTTVQEDVRIETTAARSRESTGGLINKFLPLINAIKNKKHHVLFLFNTFLWCNFFL